MNMLLSGSLGGFPASWLPLILSSLRLWPPLGPTPGGCMGSNLGTIPGSSDPSKPKPEGGANLGSRGGAKRGSASPSPLPPTPPWKMGASGPTSMPPESGPRIPGMPPIIMGSLSASKYFFCPVGPPTGRVEFCLLSLTQSVDWKGSGKSSSLFGLAPASPAPLEGTAVSAKAAIFATKSALSTKRRLGTTPAGDFASAASKPRELKWELRSTV
mmetsp:Transcript_7849/g.15651  ORF Transcript_7849/g.15651 Transcript_7849/m.15651 type:complete len:214 (-) Transcript_7849:727-1368(-)